MATSHAAVLRITDHSSRDDIALSIAALMRKRARLPEHHTTQRAELMDQVEHLIDRWLEAPP